MLVGTTGTGKTTQMLDLISQMRQRQDRAIVFDLTGAYTSAFYDPKTDITLNPMDERCPTWSIFGEGKNHSDFTGMAAALMPIDGGASEPFWNLAARTLFVETCMKLIARGTASNRALATSLMMADLKSVHKLLANTVADPLTAPEAARMAESIRAVFNTNAHAPATIRPRTSPQSAPRKSFRKMPTVAHPRAHPPAPPTPRGKPGPSKPDCSWSRH